MPYGSEKNNRPLKVGITGGIGSGKTLMTRIFSLLDVPVYYADARAKWILANNTVVKEGVLRLFGAEAYTAEGLNRKYIADKIFNKQENLEKLNALVHPEVGKDFEKWAAQKTDTDYVLKEAALLFESGSYKLLDKVITVFSPENLRIERLLKREDHRSEKEIRAIMAKQLSEQEKLTRADFVIYNDESRLLIPQVIELDKTLRNLAKIPA